MIDQDTDKILIALQRLFRESARLGYVRDSSIIISEIEGDLLDFKITELPAIQILPGGENVINGERITVIDGKEIQINILNHYMKSDTILFGDKRTVGLLKFIKDLKLTISDTPLLYGACQGWVPDSRRILPMAIPDKEPFTVGRTFFLTFKTIESVNAG